MTHEELRRLLPGYAAGAITDDDAAAVRRHIAEGCVECLHDVFSRPIGAPATAIALPPAPRPSRTAFAAGFVAAAALAAVVAGGVGGRAPGHRGGRVADADLEELTALRTSLQERLATLERAATAAGGVSREADEARAAMIDVERQLDTARDRIAALKRAMRRQDADFRQKQQSMEAVITRLSAAARPAPGPSARTGCEGVPEAARDVCMVFCQVQQCDRRAGADCDALRARFEALTGAASPPCATAMVAGALSPCNGTHVDVWAFDARAGQQYTVTADTIDGATAADLCVVGTCNGAATFTGDDEFPCRAAPGFACPRATFAVPSDTTCTVAVTVCSAGCADGTIARYELRVNGASDLTAVADDGSVPPREPTRDTDSTS